MTGTRSIAISWLRILLAADPDFYKDAVREPEYEFSRRTFRANPKTRGAYGIEWSFDNEFSDEFESFEGAVAADNGWDQ